MKLKHPYFIIKVDYKRKLKNLIISTLYFSVNKNINEENFQINYELINRVEKIRCTPVFFKNSVTSDEVLNEFKENSLRPANLFELLAFNEELDFNFTLLALGSFTYDFYGNKLIPGINFTSNYINHFWWNESIVKKNLSLYSYDKIFEKNTYFLAVVSQPL